MLQITTYGCFFLTMGPVVRRCMFPLVPDAVHLSKDEDHGGQGMDGVYKRGNMMNNCSIKGRKSVKK